MKVSELRFKDEDSYFTTEGYPLGTGCWYVRAECDGFIKYCCGDTPSQALRVAADFLEGKSV